MPSGFAADMSKVHGFRVGLSWQCAALTLLDWSHNEFWNMVTDLLPAGFLMATSLAAWSQYDSSEDGALLAAYAATTLASAVQHMCSLASHAFCCVSPRISHSVWFLDYAGIVIEFVWNAPAMAFVAVPSLERIWPFWACANLLATLFLLGGALHLVATYEPPCSSARGGEGWTSAFFGHGFLSLLTFVLLIVPNFAFTALAGVTADPFALSIGLALPLAIAVKEAHLPERRSPPGRFDFSVLHSHCLWHLCVCGLQCIYMIVIERALQMPAPTAEVVW
eukprot:CAMPEP_0119398766 /NCGR_PEP_ID=MMETSP1334-20130426/141016_1 /TAXON_ID=127549 /ORGANISM="Calcidiscus leptoporus, Strain RCC1130" /LENGTH=278 /DNA_ID=CAMNT_0007422641 /DNA_START=247 /DNA_END=1080 /DNA_ORIENTATION=+